MRPKRASPDDRRNLLSIARLQALPCYKEILRRLTEGQSARSLALWLTRQNYEGPSGQWSLNYWRKLLAPLNRDVRVARGHTASAERRKRRHPEPPKPEQIAQILAEVLDPRMQLLNVIDPGVKKVWKHVEETREAITAEDVLKFAFLQQTHRVSQLIALEDGMKLLLPNGCKEIAELRKIGEALLKLEVLQGKHALAGASAGVPQAESEIAQKMREFDPVDRNLLRTATMKVIDMIQEEAGAKFETSGLGVDTRAEATAEEPGRTGAGCADDPESTGSV
jgi:hypothetical protein